MIVHEPRVEISVSEVIVSSKIDIDSKKVAYPEEFWFSFPSEYAGFITPRNDAFAAAMLPLAMALGEDLIVKGTLSARLLFGLRECNRVLHCWVPDRLKEINVVCDAVAEYDVEETPKAVGLSFSGGVDAYFSLKKHMQGEERVPGYEITHCNYVHGIERWSDLDDNSGYKGIEKMYKKILGELGIELIMSKTNMRKFLDTMDGWYLYRFSSGAVLSMPALLLGRLFSKYYIASTYEYNDNVAYGSHPALDHHYGTETLQVIHDAASYSRYDKVKELADWTVAQDSLHVCWRYPGTVQNCCNCEKCRRTMLHLEILGALSDFSCFEEPYNRNRLRHSLVEYREILKEYEDAIGYARNAGRRDIEWDLRYMVMLNRMLYMPAFRMYSKIKSYIEGFRKS